MTSSHLPAMTSASQLLPCTIKGTSSSTKTAAISGATPPSRPIESAWHSDSSKGPTRTRYCLSSAEGLIKNHDSTLVDQNESVWTTQPSEALQFASLDAAALRAQRLLHLFPTLQVSEFHFSYTATGKWQVCHAAGLSKSEFGASQT